MIGCVVCFQTPHLADKLRFSEYQETMMDHPLRTISYIADIGNIVVLMARRRMPRPDSQENVEASDPGQDSKRQYKMICHVFESEDVSLTAVMISLLVRWVPIRFL